MDDTRHYAGPIGTELPQGLHGGTCALRVAGGAFELRLERPCLHGSGETDIVRGACGADADGLTLDAREWQRRRSGTSMHDAAAPLAGRWHARHAGPPGDPGAVLALAFALGTEVIDVLLLREGEAPPATPLAADVARASAARDAGLAAARARREAVARRDRRAAASAASFAAGDYASVLALLAPEEGDLTRAEAMRLALARQRLDGRG